MARKKTTETAAPDAHSSIVGGSNAAMRLACSGSYALEQRLPKGAKKGSAYADEGTALHGAIAWAIENDIVDAAEMEGMEFAGHDDEDGSDGEPYVMTKELITNALQPALAHFDKLIEEDQEAFWVVEKRVPLPGIPEAFGTCDLIICLPTVRKTKVNDWKFGVGVPVKALYVEEDDYGEYERLNAQLCFYARAAMHAHPELFGGEEGGGFSSIPDDWEIELHIAQPRARVKDEDNADDERFTSASVSKDELEEFRMQLIKAVTAAQSVALGKEPPSYQRGDHCRFAACKSLCPKFTEPVLDLTKMHQAIEARKATPLGDVFDYGEALAAILDLGPVVKLILDEAGKQAHALLENGGRVPGYKLAPTRATRHWKLDEKAIVDLFVKQYGVQVGDMYEAPKLRSPAQVEEKLAELGRHGGKKTTLPETWELVDERTGAKAKVEVIHKVSSGTKVVNEKSDAADAIPTAVLVENFGQKLLALMPSS